MEALGNSNRATTGISLWMKLADNSRRIRFSKALGFDQATESAVRRRLARSPRHALRRLHWRAIDANIGGGTGAARSFPFPACDPNGGATRVGAGAVAGRAGKCAGARRCRSVLRLLAELRGNCAEPWTLDQMAARLQLRRTRFSALFRHYTGDAPLHYLLRLRVERARHLLRTTDRSVTEIAMACGFASSQHLAKIFHQFTGLGICLPANRAASLLLPRSQSR